MNARRHLCRFLITTLVPFVLFAGVAELEQLPKSAAIGSNPPGTLFYALASGLAKIVSDSTSVQTQVQPYSGTSTFLPMMDSGDPISA